MPWWRRTLAVQTKVNATDVVTRADREAEERILAELAVTRPRDGVLGEEGGYRPSRSGRTWVVDPVDGTYNFVRGSARWCTAVSLRDDSGVLLGAVRQETTKGLWAGGPQSWPTENDVPLPPMVDRPLAESALLTYLHPPHHNGDPAGDVWRSVVGAVGTVRISGSGSLDATDVAAGRGDLVLHHSVPDWDRLPGEALIRGVGGDARQIEAGGVEWYVAGAPSAVAEACDRLAGR